MARSEFQSLEVIGIKRVDESAGSVFIQFDSGGAQRSKTAKYIVHLL